MATQHVSAISGKRIPSNQAVSAHLLRDTLIALIQRDHPKFTAQSHLTLKELEHYRKLELAQSLSQQLGELDAPETAVLRSLTDETILTGTLRDEEEHAVLTRGERLADAVAEFGGSWTFICAFGAFLLIWIGINVWALHGQGFDPYPFILLNLILSCIAALQAPVIMMSQNRQADKDRERALQDYQINLKAELEIRTLHERVAQLTMLNHACLRRLTDPQDPHTRA